MKLSEQIKQNKRIPDSVWMVAAAVLAAGTLLSSVVFFILWPDNLMHSDMAAEVMLSKLLSEEGRLLSKNWFYSTEIRIVYTQLVMTPLFCFIRDFGTVKLISIIIYDLLLAVVFYFTAKAFGLKKSNIFLMMALLAAPLSNEYFDMMLLGNFYTSQAVCTYLVLMFFYGAGRPFTEKEKADADGKAGGKQNAVLWLKYALLCFASVILGLSGLRYFASLFIPVVLSVITGYVSDGRRKRREYPFWEKLILSVCMTGSAGVGFLIHKFYLAANYSFDTTPVHFVPIAQVPERFLKSLYLMVEFVGYRDVEVMSKLGAVNLVKFAFLLLLVFAVGFLTKHRNDLLTETQRLLLYYFYFLFFINWYMLVFTDVLQQYRYWLPVYIIAVLLLGICLQTAAGIPDLVRLVCIGICVITVPASLYGELWQDTKYNDCAKRYGYMRFLEDNQYEFGYATFWNADVTEYLSNGTIHVGNLGGNENGSAPYEWLSRKEYYKEGYHTGKTFLLLARTEEPALFNGDITVMTDSIKVYEDEFYVIYEGKGMYLFSE